MRILNELDSFRLLGAISLRSPFGQRDHAMIRFAMHTGLRVGELTGLDVRHVWNGEGPREWLDLPAGICKNHRSRRVPLNPAAQRAIRELIAFLRARGFSTDQEAPLLTDRRHGRLKVREVQRCIQKYRELAQLDVRVTPHSLRHSYASRLVKEGANVRRVQQLVDHVRLTTTEVYLHNDPADLVEAVNMLVGP